MNWDVLGQGLLQLKVLDQNWNESGILNKNLSTGKGRVNVGKKKKKNIYICKDNRLSLSSWVFEIMFDG